MKHDFLRLLGQIMITHEADFVKKVYRGKTEGEGVRGNC